MPQDKIKKAAKKPATQGGMGPPVPPKVRIDNEMRKRKAKISKRSLKSKRDSAAKEDSIQKEHYEQEKGFRKDMENARQTYKISRRA